MEIFDMDFRKVGGLWPLLNFLSEIVTLASLKMEFLQVSIALLDSTQIRNYNFMQEYW